MINPSAEMFEYHSWANRTILGRIHELPSTVLHQEVNSSFPTIAHVLSHIYAVDTMWYMVLTGTEMPEALQACIPLNSQVLDSVEEYGIAYDALTAQYREWLQSEPEWEQTLLLNNPFAAPRHTHLSEIMLHVVNHGTYHRGNVSTMLRQLGHASIQNDYSLFWYQENTQTLQP